MTQYHANRPAVNNGVICHHRNPTRSIQYNGNPTLYVQNAARSHHQVSLDVTTMISNTSKPSLSHSRPLLLLPLWHCFRLNIPFDQNPTETDPCSMSWGWPQLILQGSLQASLIIITVTLVNQTATHTRPYQQYPYS